MRKVLNFNTFKSLFNTSSCSKSVRLHNWNHIHEIHTSNIDRSKRFTRCSECGKEFKPFKDPCCPLLPPEKSPPMQPPKKPQEVEKQHLCFQPEPEDICVCAKHLTNDCPPEQLPPCPKGNWNQGDD